MMVRYFLRISHIARAHLLAAIGLVFAAGVIPATAAVAAEHGVNADIGKFMEGYARELAKQLGARTRVEYNAPTLAASAETRTCPEPLAVSARDQTQSLSRVTLFIACGSEWSIYVPVDLHVFRPVAIATKPLASGTVVTAEDVELTAVDVSQLIGTYLTSLDEAIGMGVKRPIAPGRPLFSQQLEPPLLIHRGETVVISAEAGSLAVKMTGTALTDGHRGEQIRIKNQATSRIVDARVIAPGQVVVSM